ncbi:MAG: TonB-dependent receptor plug domain-containing protein, partial [Parvularcula sp.]|nr:TonB-dependent receptor plug domain-containing protein [Parvularcula sp.]
MNSKLTFRQALKLSSAAASLAVLTGTAFAQVQPAEPVDDDDVIVVTGSRLQADNTLQSAGPVVAFGAEDIRESGQLDIGALLRESPALQASLPATFSAFNGTPLGASFLNLRALGSERTLVLENGRRHVSGNEGTAAVDINSISTALLDRIDVSTGGASAIYGADAVSGVVNFIMRDGSDFDGLELRAQTGVTDDGDAEEYFISLANGFESADGKGNIVFATEYQFTSALTSGERDFAGSGLQGLLPNGPASGIDQRFSNVWLPDVTLPISSDYGIIALGDGGASAF